MDLDDHTAQEHLTPEERRKLLRAFADRMLLKVTAMDDPKDLPGVEKAMRVAAVIERVYNRCDRAERQIRDKTPDPRKLQAERAAHEGAAIRAHVELASTLEWAENRRRNLGQWWEAAQNVTGNPVRLPKTAPETAQKTASEHPAAAPDETPHASPNIPRVTYTGLAGDIQAALAELALKRRALAQSAQIPIPPLRGPPPRSG